MDNQGFQVMKRLNDDIIKAIAANDVRSLAGKFYSVDLLPPGDYETICEGSLTTTNASRLVTLAVTKKVKANASDFQKFVCTLKDMGEMDALVKKLENNDADIVPLNETTVQGNEAIDSITGATSVFPTTGSQDNVILSVTKEIKEVNFTLIRKKYSSLQMKIAKRLTIVDMEELKFHIESIFEPEQIGCLLADDSSVLKIFRNLTNHHLWSYSNITKLSLIAKEFINNDEIKKDIDDYNGSLVGYKACTKILQKMVSDNLNQDSEDDEEEEKEVVYNTIKERDPSNSKMDIRKRLVVKILEEGEQEKGINVTSYSIKYLDDIFEAIRIKFKLTLDAVLHKVALNSIEVTWFIPSISALLILNKLYDAVGFFEQFHISMMTLEGVQIYSKKSGVVNSKELDKLYLLLAVQDRNVQQVNIFIQKCSEALNEPIKEKDYATLLMTAAFGGSVDVISSLIHHGANINQQDVNGWTALSYACIAGHKEAFNLLVKHGTDLALPSKSSTCSNILELMKRHNKSEMLELLKGTLEQKMIEASKNGNSYYVQKALGMGASVDAVDQQKDGWRSLIWASKLGHLEVVKCLLDHGSNPNLKSGEDELTPLIVSCKYGHHEITECLLDNGAEVDQENAKGYTALRFAAAYGHTEAGRVLIHHKAMVNHQDPRYGYTPLLHAAQKGYTDFVSMMIEEVPNLDLDLDSSEKGGGWNPLMVACKNSHQDTVMLLLQKGANSNHRNHNNAAAIQVAKFIHHDELVNLLKLYNCGDPPPLKKQKIEN